MVVDDIELGGHHRGKREESKELVSKHQMQPEYGE